MQTCMRSVAIKIEASSLIQPSIHAPLFTAYTVCTTAYIRALMHRSLTSGIAEVMSTKQMPQ